MGVLKGPGTRRSEGRTGKQRAPSEQRLLTPARFPPRPGRAPAAAGGAGKGQSYRSPLCDGRHSRPGAGARREGGRERDGRPQGRHGRTARTVTAQPGPPTCGRSGGEQRVAPQLPAPLSAARAGAKAQTEPFPCERQGQTQTRPPPPPTHRAGERRLLRGVPADAHRALGGRRAKLSAACGAGGTLTPQPCQKHCMSHSRATVVLVRERKASWGLCYRRMCSFSDVPHSGHLGPLQAFQEFPCSSPSLFASLCVPGRDGRWARPLPKH